MYLCVSTKRQTFRVRFGRVNEKDKEKKKKEAKGRKG